MTESFTLAHFSDVHLPPLASAPWRYWNLKRGLGYLNWLRQRRFVHERETADLLLADALRLRPDHFAVTGDLTNFGLPQEHADAFVWLQSIGRADRVTVIPGNHDIYSSIGGDKGVSRWAAYMNAEAETLAFPFVRRVGPLALIGLNSAIETPPFYAHGRLGLHQLDVVQEMLARLRAEGAIRVVLIHHPPLAGMTSDRRALIDAQHFARVLEREGAELVLYGHNHRPGTVWAAGPDAPVPVVAAASASAKRTHKLEPLAQYNLFTFFRGAGGLRIRHVVRGLREPGGPVAKLSETFLDRP